MESVCVEQEEKGGYLPGPTTPAAMSASPAPTSAPASPPLSSESLTERRTSFHCRKCRRREILARSCRMSMKRSSVDMDLLPRRVARMVHSRSMCCTWSWTMDSIRVVVSGDGSPVSPETNIIWGIVRDRPMSCGSRGSGNAEREDGVHDGDDIGVEGDIAAACRMGGEKRRESRVGVVVQEQRASCGSALTRAWAELLRGWEMG
jgi:hypothetical protein